MASAAVAPPACAEPPLPTRDLLPFAAAELARAPDGAPQPAHGTLAAPDGESSFECNVCLELATDPVITLCGHLYCWPCLYRWLALNQECKTCPVCKAGVEEDKVVPLYGRGGNGQDPRKHPVDGLPIPSRPAAQRPPVQMAYAAGRAPPPGGLGIVPSVFGLHGGTGGAGPHGGVMYGEPLSPEQQQQAFLSRLLLMLGSFVIMCLLLF